MADVNPARPITVEAFRFVHLKNPDLYYAKSFDLDFVTHPSPESSVILNGEEEFEAYTSLSAVRQVNPNLYNFMFWLKANKAQLTADNLAQATKDVASLTANQRLTIWDNLLYQTQIEHSATLVEGLIRLLQADHFIGHYLQAVEQIGEGELALGDLRKAAKASVVIPHQLFSSEPSNTNNTNPTLDAKSRTVLADRLELARLHQQLEQHSTALEAVAAAERVYQHDYAKGYEQAFKAYQIEVNALLENSKGEGDEATSSEPYIGELPVFNFQPENTWDDAYLQTKLDPQHLSLYQHYKTPQDRYIADTRRTIEKATRDLQSQRFNLQQKQAPQTLVHQGIRIPLRNHPLNNSYVFKAIPLIGQTNRYSLYVTQYVEMPATKVRSIQANTTGSEGAITSKVVKPIHESEQYITFELFPEGILLDEATTSFSVTGTFETEDPAYSNSFEYSTIYGEQLVAPKTTPTKPDASIPVPNLFGLMGVKIAEFKKVNQTLCCYVEGEVSHIENIMAREYKEKQTRNLRRSEVTTERSTEREAEELNDTTSTERYELQSEISQVMQEDSSNNMSASASVNGSWPVGTGNMSFGTSGSFGTSSSSSSSSNFSEAESYAKEVTARAMKRIVERTSYKRTAKMIQEFEETQKHGFDNREGDKHVTGVYRWVDKIYQNDLVNYGKRLMYEFMLPEPAKNYKHLLEENLKKGKATSCDTTTLTEPLHPKSFGVENYWDINENNFDDVVGYYNLEVEEYPVRHRRIAKSFSENCYLTGSQKGDKLWHVAHDFELAIPKGYLCTGFDCQFVAKRHGNDENIYGDLLIGDLRRSFSNEWVHSISAFTASTHLGYGAGLGFTPVEDYLPISMAAQDVGVFALNIWAHCEIKDETFDEFRTQLFGQMHRAYNQMVLEYEDRLREQCQNKALEENGDETLNYNIHPLQARAIEGREIKRLIIEQIIELVDKKLRPQSVAWKVGYDYYQQDPCNNTFNLKTGNTFLKEQMRYARFLEQAFEWDIMAYSFLPYYWGDENSWGDLLSIDSAADHIFLAFLQSGMANVVLPVKPGLEKSVAFLLETGRLWLGDGFILDGQDDLYPAIEQQLQIEVDADGNEIRYDATGKPIPVVEATWETRMPSTLTIIQDYSNPLNDQGLPCFCEDDPSKRIGFAPSLAEYNTLKGQNNTTGGN